MDDKYLVIILILAQAGLIAWRVVEKLINKNPKNRYSCPCEKDKHGERLATLEKGQKTIEEDIELLRKENREDHHKLFEKLNRKATRR